MAESMTTYQWSDGNYYYVPETGASYQTSSTVWDADSMSAGGWDTHTQYSMPAFNTSPSSSSDDTSEDDTSNNYNYSYTYQVAHTKTYTTQDKYMRQRTVNFNASGLTPQATGFYLTFNGATVSGVTPASGFSQDSSGKGTFKTDSKGSFSGSFTVPANVPTGIREVVFTNGKDNCSATYTATGTTEHTETYYTTETYDPLAEIFKFSNDYYLTR